MIIIPLLVLRLDVPMVLRRSSSPYVFEFFEDKKFVELDVTLWDGNLSSLSKTRCALIDLEDYYNYWNPGFNWKCREFFEFALPLGHVAFRRNGIVLPNGEIDRINICNDLQYLINRIRSSALQSAW